MYDKNNIILIGRLGTDPQRLPTNDIGARFKLVTNEKVYSKKLGDYKTVTEWNPIKCWKSDAEFALERLNKGDRVMVEGKIHNHVYTISEGPDGEKKGKHTEIMATSVQLLDREINVDDTNVNKVLSDLIEEGQLDKTLANTIIDRLRLSTRNKK